MSMNDWPQMAREMSKLVKELREGSPDAMAAFSSLAQAGTSDGALDQKTRELIALAISVAVRCAPCIAFHAKAAAAKGASREEVAETLATAVYMGAGPSVMYASEALEAYDQFADRAKPATA